MVYIDHVPLEQYGARLQLAWRVTGANALGEYYRPRYGTGLVLMGGVDAGLKTITLPVDIYGDSPRDVTLRKSVLDAAAARGRVELYLPDGLYYTAVVQTLGQLDWASDTLAGCTYEFAGLAHDPAVCVTVNGPMACASTVPRTDCVLSVTVGTAAASYNLAGVRFTDVDAGDTLTLDGWTKRVLINGVPAAQRCDIVEWPYLAPGANAITAPDPVTVRYYPTYL